MHLSLSGYRGLSRIKDVARREYILICAVIFGGALRAYQLPGQIPFGDEWHAIYTAARSGYMGILSCFGASDHSIPIALYYRLAMDTVGLSEWVIRAPFFLAGTLTILILPLLIRNITGRFTANIFAWLLALSPTLIFFSRTARPYAIIGLSAFAAAILVKRWWTEGLRHCAVLYVVLTTITGYFLLVALPFVLGPLLFFLGSALLGPKEGRYNSIRRLTVLLIWTILPLALLLALPLCNDFQAIESKAGHSFIQPRAVLDAFRILFSMEGIGISILMGALSFAGMIRLRRTGSTLLGYLIALSGLQLISILVVRPLGSDSPHILARYLLPVLPCLLLFSAAGIVGISTATGLSRNKRLRPLLPVALCAALITGGPVMAVTYNPNNATGLILLIHSLAGEKHQWMLKRMPEFYRRLSTYPPASLIIVEAPFNWPGDHVPLYQRVHRQTILAGITDGLCGEATSSLSYINHLRTVVDLSDLWALLNRDVNFVVFHKRLQEEVRVRLPSYRRQEISGCIAQYRAWFGSPVFEDRDIIVFELSKD